MEWSQGNKEVLIICNLITAYCAYTDWRYRKIYNYITFPFFILSVLYILMFRSEQVVDSLKAFGLLSGIFFPLFIAGIVGAGDIKLLQCLSILFGLNQSLQLVTTSLFVGAAIGFLQLLMSGGLRDYFRRVIDSLVSLTVPHLSFHLPKFRKLHTLPFGVVIFISCVFGQIL